ncbi:MAG: hypothetical protein GXO39_06315 [Thermotogae bacterium]|nr:hypothetical protein [Thermotogota bacterium]
MKHTASFLKLPDVFTTIRLVLIPAVFWAIPINPYLALLILGVIFFTDIMDGYLARKMRISDRIFGKVYDHLVDKLLILTITYALNVYKGLPNWAYMFFLVREFLLIIGGVFIWLSTPAHVDGSNVLGKAAGITFYAMVIAYIFQLPFREYLLYLSVAMSSLAFLSYAYREIRKLSRKQ